MSESTSSLKEMSFPKNEIKCLILEKISQSAVNILVSQGYQVETIDRLTKEELIEKIKNVHVIGVRSKTKLTEDVLQHAKKLLCVGCFCIGTDQTNLEFAATRGIPVFNSPFANTRSVAELVLAQSIILARQACDRNREMHAGIWRKTAVGCHEVRGKVMGIIGYGHVGSQLSVLAEGLGFRVIYFDIIPKLPLGNARSCASMAEVLQLADFLTLHVPYTQRTHQLIGAQQIKKMKPGSYLLNAARGKCVDTTAVAEALKSGHLAGAYFDVYPQEPIDHSLVLRDCPNTAMTPHIGGSTEEAQANIGIEVATKLTQFINEGKTIGAVNFPTVELGSALNCHRVLHIHKNVPGVLRTINDVLSRYNISAQVLKTTPNIGYLLVDMDADKSFSASVRQKMDEMEETIRTRVVYSPGM